MYAEVSSLDAWKFRGNAKWLEKKKKTGQTLKDGSGTEIYILLK